MKSLIIFMIFMGLLAYAIVGHLNEITSSNLQEMHQDYLQEMHQDYLERMEAKGIYPGMSLEEYNNLNK